MKYLRGSLYMPLILEAEDVHVIKWWVDTSFAAHPDMKSHTGGTMSDTWWRYEASWCK